MTATLKREATENCECLHHAHKPCPQIPDQAKKRLSLNYSQTFCPMQMTMRYIPTVQPKNSISSTKAARQSRSTQTPCQQMPISEPLARKPPALVEHDEVSGKVSGRLEWLCNRLAALVHLIVVMLTILYHTLKMASSQLIYRQKRNSLTYEEQWDYNKTDEAADNENASVQVAQHPRPSQAAAFLLVDRQEARSPFQRDPCEDTDHLATCSYQTEDCDDLNSWNSDMELSCNTVCTSRSLSHNDSCSKRQQETHKTNGNIQPSSRQMAFEMDVKSDYNHTAEKGNDEASTLQMAHKIDVKSDHSYAATKGIDEADGIQMAHEMDVKFDYNDAAQKGIVKGVTIQTVHKVDVKSDYSHADDKGIEEAGTLQMAHKMDIKSDRSHAAKNGIDDERQIEIKSDHNLTTERRTNNTDSLHSVAGTEGRPRNCQTAEKEADDPQADQLTEEKTVQENELHHANHPFMNQNHLEEPIPEQNQQVWHHFPERNLTQSQHLSGPSPEPSPEDNVQLRQPRWRGARGRRRMIVPGGRSSQRPDVVDLRSKTIDRHCLLDAPRRSGFLRRILHEPIARRSLTVSTQNMMENRNDDSILLEEFLTRLRTQRAAETDRCVQCTEQPVETVFLNCHHAVVCLTCAQNMQQWSCCPYSGCGVPPLCYIFIG